MNPEPGLRPYGDAPPERSGSSPHLSDYWQVVARRLWLVLLVFGVTTASAIWTVSRQRVYYQSHLSLQVNDPVQPARGLVQPGRISGLDIFVDPIESEIQVLRSTPIATAVIDSLGLRLRPASPDRLRSDLFRDVRVERGAPEQRFELAYDGEGRNAQLRTMDGAELGAAPVGSRLETPSLSFTVLPPPEEARVYAVDLVAQAIVTAEIVGNLSASPRESTNLIDVYFLALDSIIVPHVLNVAAAELRKRGADRVARRADGGHRLRRAAAGQRAQSAHPLGIADSRLQAVWCLQQPVRPGAATRHAHPEPGRAATDLGRAAERPRAGGAGPGCARSRAGGLIGDHRQATGRSRSAGASTGR